MTWEMLKQRVFPPPSRSPPGAANMKASVGKDASLRSFERARCGGNPHDRESPGRGPPHIDDQRVPRASLFSHSRAPATAIGSNWRRWTCSLTSSFSSSFCLPLTTAHLSFSLIHSSFTFLFLSFISSIFLLFLPDSPLVSYFSLLYLPLSIDFY